MAIEPALRKHLIDEAFAVAKRSFDEGGVPIGAVVALADGTIVGASSNRRMQEGDQTAHAEISAVRAAGPDVDLTKTVLATTLMPCWMCSGMVEHLGIPTVIVGDDESWPDGALDWLRTRSVDVIVEHDRRCKDLLETWVAKGQELWRPPCGDQPDATS